MVKIELAQTAVLEQTEEKKELHFDGINDGKPHQSDSEDDEQEQILVF